MHSTETIYHRDGRQKTVDVHEASRMVAGGQGWSFTAPPPPGWEREIPKYKATRDLQPSLKERHRFEPPFGMVSDSDVWQYATRRIKAQEIIQTKEWPHPSFQPLSYGAGKVLDFFNTRQKSRLPLAPWQSGSIRLDDGLTGSGIAPIAVKPQPAAGV